MIRLKIFFVVGILLFLQIWGCSDDDPVEEESFVTELRADPLILEFSGEGGKNPLDFQ